MSKKPRVTFKIKRISEDDWQVVAEYPGGEARWLAGSRRIDWLRSQGYAK
jgi:hypothetical protein